MSSKLLGSRTSSNSNTFHRLGVLALAATAAAVLAASPAIAAKPPGTDYNESIHGDFSSSGLAPTTLDFQLGNNWIEGFTGLDSAGAIDRDYFTFTLASGQALSFIQVLEGTRSIGLSFIGVQEGDQVTVSPSGPDATGLLGWYHYSSGDVGSDILDNIGVAAAGSSGFNAPLGPGTYTFWIQEASPGDLAHYGFNFFVTEAAGVPEPGTWAMMLLGFGAAGFALRRSRRGMAATAASA